MSPVNAVLISTYELGRQPFGLASPAAWLRRAGASVSCMDLSREPLQEQPVRSADFIAFFVPMHTATRLAVSLLPSIRKLNPSAPLCFYGLYAPVNESYLRELGAETVLGGEFESGLVQAFERARARRQESAPSGKAGLATEAPPAVGGRPPQPEPLISLARHEFLVPERGGLPPLIRYAHVTAGDGHRRTAGYTEASRGCKHLCRHCPIVPVYGGRFRIVQQEVVLEDIRRQVAAGAEHITLGDPDFFNGPRHALSIVQAVHEEHPHLSYDVTIKIEHLLKYSRHISTLRDTGCLFVTSAVESIDDRVLARLDKGHTYADFARVVGIFRHESLVLAPTFVAFTPWITLEGYCELLSSIARLGLVEAVAPVQLAIRLLIPSGSRLLELPEAREMVGRFDKAGLVYPWMHSDPHVDVLCSRTQELVLRGEKRGDSRRTIFSRVWELAHEMAGLTLPRIPEDDGRVSRAAIPYLTEPWYC